MRFAPVMPPSFYKDFDLGTYHMVQAHMFWQNVAAMDWLRSLDDRHTIIVDNGSYELGRPHTEALAYVASNIQRCTAVCPDSFRNERETIQLASNYLMLLKGACKCVMLVPQGDNMAEWKRCAEGLIRFARLSDINFVIGLPKVLDTFKDQGRFDALTYVNVEHSIPLGRIHLLGLWNGLKDLDRTLKYFPEIGGVDSTLPYAHAWGAKRTEPGTVKIQMDEHAWKAHVTMMPTEMLCLLEENIQAIRDYIRLRRQSAIDVRLPTGHWSTGSEPDQTRPEPSS